MIEFYENKQCKCGCGGRIRIYVHHKYTGIPEYVNHHGMNGKKQSDYQKRTVGLRNSIAYKGKSVEERGHKLNCNCNFCRVKRGDNSHINQERRLNNWRISLVKKLKIEGKHWNSNRLGELHPAWCGGDKDYSKDWNNYLKEKVRDRDNYICQNLECGQTQESNGKKLDVHHIDYNKFNCKTENLISLCESCHRKSNFNRDYWYAYYTKVMENKDEYVVYRR